MREGLLTEFAAQLAELRASAGQPSYADLTRLDARLRRATMSDVLNGKTKPSSDFVHSFVRACGRFATEHGHTLQLGAADPAGWHERWVLLVTALAGAMPPHAAAASAAQPVGDVPVPRQLPPTARWFAGRDAELEALDTLASTPASAGTPTVIVVDGLAGSGKSALALRWAHANLHRFPDGQLFADLRGSVPGGPANPAVVLDSFLHALGSPPPQADDLDRLAASFRSTVAGRRLLLLLDDAESGAQVMPLLPAAAGSLVLITSRTKLPELVVDVDAEALPVGPMTPPAALLALNALTPVRAGAEPEAARELVTLCGGLPLALRLAVRSLGESQSLEQRCRQLRSLGGRVAGLDEAVRDSRRLNAVFRASVAGLPPDVQRALSQLAAHSGSDFSLGAASALTGQAVGRTRQLLSHLDGANLIERSAEHRYRLHELVRPFLVTTTDDDVLTTARRRSLSWYVHSAAAAAAAILPQRGPVALPRAIPDIEPLSFTSPEPAQEWFARELGNLAEAAEVALNHQEYATAAAIPSVTLSYLNLRKPWPAWVAMFMTATRAAEAAGDEEALAGALNALGIAYRETRRLAAAADHLRRAADAYQRADHVVGASMALNNLAALLMDQRRFVEAAAVSREALAIFGDTPDQWRRGILMNNLANAYALQGDVKNALAFGEQALALSREIDDAAGEGCALTAIGEAHVYSGNLVDARDAFRAAVTRSIAGDDDYNRARTERRLAEVLLELGDRDGARDAAESAAIVFDELHDPGATEVRDLLARIDPIERTAERAG